MPLLVSRWQQVSRLVLTGRELGRVGGHLVPLPIMQLAPHYLDHSPRYLGWRTFVVAYYLLHLELTYHYLFVY